jgi:hypothetical protein
MRGVESVSEVAHGQSGGIGAANDRLPFGRGDEHRLAVCLCVGAELDGVGDEGVEFGIGQSLRATEGAMRER